MCNAYRVIPKRSSVGLDAEVWATIRSLPLDIVRHSGPGVVVRVQVGDLVSSPNSARFAHRMRQ